MGKKSGDRYRQNPYSLKVDQWELIPKDIVIEEQMSEGFFGKVYRGSVKGPLNNSKLSPSLRNSINVPVAIKLLKGRMYNVTISLPPFLPPSLSVSLYFHLCVFL